ncbi:MAG: hypothetical protein IKJ65_02165 [Clostridia bacterium]|nr:hypothetical protein [Clostridia bacterium]
MNLFSSANVRRVSVGLLIFALMAGFFLFFYQDIADTLDNAVMFTECVIDGHPLSFYEYSAKHAAPGTEYSANYNILLYALFAVWNLPTSLMHIYAGFDYTSSVLALLWSKLMVVFFYALIAREMAKLVKLLAPDQKDAPKLSVFLLFSSLCAFVPAMIAVQYDCISLWFMLLAVRLYAEKKDAQCILVFALSVPFKLFSVFLLIPMVLLRHKNVLKILLRLLPVLIPSALLSIPFKDDAYYLAAIGSQNGDAIRLILNAVISINNMQIGINLFLIAYFLLCLFAYSRKESDAVSEGKMAVYLGFIAFAAFSSLTPIRSYWIVLCVPFLAVLASILKGSRTMAVLTDTLMSLGGGIYILANHWIYNTGKLFSSLILKNVSLPEGMQAKYAAIPTDVLSEGGAAEFGHLAGFLDSLGLGPVRFVFMALFIACALFAMWKLYPLSERETAPGSKGEKWVLLARPAILIFVCLLLVYVNFAYVPKPAYAVGGEETIRSEIDLSRESCRSAPFTFENDVTLTAFSMPVAPEEVNRTSRSMIRFTLTDEETGKILWEDKIGIAELIKKDRITIGIEGVRVMKNTPCILKIEGEFSDRFPDGSVYPYHTQEGEIVFSFR